MAKAEPSNPIGILLREPWVETALDLPSLVEMLLNIGFDFLEIPEKYRWNQKELNYLQKIHKDGKVFFKLHSSTPSGRVNLNDPRIPFDIEPTFRLAKALGAKIVTFDFDSTPVPDDEKKRYTICATRAKKTMKAAKKIGAIAAFENADVRDYAKTGAFKFGMKPEDFHRLIKDFPELKITLDGAHLFLSASYWNFNWKEDFVEPLAPHIVHVHLSDNSGKEGGYGSKSLADSKLGDLHLPLDMGQVPWGEIITALWEKEYTGGFSLEIKPENFSFTTKEITDHIKKSYQLLADFVRGD